MTAHRGKTTPFEKLVLVTIAANTAVVAWGFFDHAHEEMLAPIHTGLLLFWVVELGVRWRTAGSWRVFIRSAWNVFDSVVVLLSLLPALGVGVTLLRVARGARVLHSLRHVSHLRAAAVVRFTRRKPQPEAA